LGFDTLSSTTTNHAMFVAFENINLKNYDIALVDNSNITKSLAIGTDNSGLYLFYSYNFTDTSTVSCVLNGTLPSVY
jgi:hypothetical protein